MKIRIKKYTAIFLAISLLFSVLAFPSMAEDENESFPFSYMEDLIAQWRENPDSELWLPLLPERAAVSSLAKSETANVYGLNPGFTIDGQWVVSIIFHTVEDYPAPGHVPTTRLLIKKGLDPVDLTEEMLNVIQKGDEVEYSSVNQSNSILTYEWIVAAPPVTGQYQKRPAAVTCFHAFYNPSGSFVFDGRYHEILVALSEQVLVSIIAEEGSHTTGSATTAQFRDDAYMSQLDELFGIRFTTMGDANLDGVVNAMDALAMLRYAVNQEYITDRTAFLLSDVDGSGGLDAADALYALRRAVGKQK